MKNWRTLHSWGEWLVDSEEMAITMNQYDGLGERYGLPLKQHPNVGEAMRVLCGRAGSGRMGREDICLLNNHDRSAIPRLRALETLTKPSQICLVALRVFGISVGRAPKPVVATRNMNRDERDSPSLPSNILPIFCQGGVRAPALTDQWHRTSPEALLADEEHTPHLGKPVERIAARNILSWVTISPIVVAGCEHQRMRRGAELREPTRQQVVCTCKARRREIA